MKKIALIALLGTSYAYSMNQKLTKAVNYPITCQVASSLTGYLLSDIMKSIISNDTLRGGLGMAGLVGSIFLHKLYYRPALDKYEGNKKDESLPLLEGAVTFAANTAAWAAILSSPHLVESSLKYLDKVHLKNATKVAAAPAALIGYCALMALD